MFKALVPDPTDQGVILVRGVPFGSPQNKDMHGQYFTQNTNFLSHILPLPPVFHFHGAKSGSLADQIGETLGREQRQDGIWYRAKLHLDSTTEAVKTKANELWKAAKAGKLFGSSGAVEATIKLADSGEILQWLVGELSLLDATNSRETPASFHATVVPVKAAGLEGIEVGNVTLDQLNINDAESDFDDGKAHQDDSGLQKLMLNAFRKTFGVEPADLRSLKMSDKDSDLLVQLQKQVADLTTQLAVVPQLQTQVTELSGQLQTRDTTIGELQSVISTKSAEVALTSHAAMVDAWIKEGKITPAERDNVIEVLSFAFQADTSTKGDVGFVKSIKGWIEARPANAIVGDPATVYSNVGQLNGGAAAEVGGGINPDNIKLMKRFSEIVD